MKEQQRKVWELLRQAAIGWDDFQHAADEEEYSHLEERFNGRFQALMDFVCPEGQDMIDLDLEDTK